MSDIHASQARGFGRRLLSQIRRLIRQTPVRPAVRITITTVETGETIGHTEMDFADVASLMDLVKAQADLWDAGFGAPWPAEDQLPDEIHTSVFEMTRPELADEIDSAFIGVDLDELHGDVLDATHPEHRMTVTRARDAVFGDVPTDDEEAEGTE